MTETFRFAWSEKPRGIGSKAIVEAATRAEALQKAHALFDDLDKKHHKPIRDLRTLYFMFKETKDGRPVV